ncbi:MAG: Fe2+-dependent dioxygenase [Elainella sp.]
MKRQNLPQPNLQTTPTDLHQQGLLALQEGRFAEALSWLQQAIAQDGQRPELHIHIGIAHCRFGNLTEGIAAYERAVALQPASIEARYNLALALQKQNDLVAASSHYEQLLEQQPNLIAAYYQLGNLLQAQFRFTSAIRRYQMALDLQTELKTPLNRAFPVRPESIHYNLGVAHQQLGNPQAAITAYRQALELQPSYGEAHNALATLLEKQDLEAALAHYQQAIRLLPHYLPTFVNLANLQIQRQDWEAASATFRQILQQDPNHLKAIDGLLKVCLQTADWSDLARLTEQLWRLGEHHIGTEITIYNTIFLPLTAAQQQVLAVNHAQAVARTTASLAQQLAFEFGTRRHSDHQRIRLGYVSGDFREQAVAFCLTRLFELHDRQKFEVFAYSLGPDDGSPYRQKFEADCDCFRQVDQLSTVAIAQQIYTDSIDILIDLEGHTQYSRLELYALRPAPLIVTYLGHPGTMGADYIDYIFTDATLTPDPNILTEAPVYLPEPYLLTNDQDHLELPPVRRSDFGLPEDAFVFCGFNKTLKITPDLFAAWMRILQQVPQSVLWLQASNPVAQQKLRDLAQHSGIDSDRLIFSVRHPRTQYLASYRCADLFLDAFNHSAAVTGLDLLGAGLPLLTLAGETFASRIGASSLVALDLPELIATSVEAYEQQAVYLATHAEALQALRQRLSERASAKLFNSARSVRHLESAYSLIWQRYQSGQPPAAIHVPPQELVPPPPPVALALEQPAPPDDSLSQTVPAQTVPAQTLFAQTRPSPVSGIPALYCLPDLLTVSEQVWLREQLAAAPFLSGKQTAGKYAQMVKQNTQLDPESAAYAEVSQLIVAALARSQRFQQIAYPKLIHPPLFSRYGPGMAYGTHVDSAIMGTASLRADLSLTIFLSDPASYEGGELVIQGDGGDCPIKLPAGSMVVYPASTLHRVEPVRSGVRLAAVTWVQSLVRDPSQREMLRDLSQVRDSLATQQSHRYEANLIAKTHANLLRQWAGR